MNYLNIISLILSTIGLLMAFFHEFTVTSIKLETYRKISIVGFILVLMSITLIVIDRFKLF